MGRVMNALHGELPLTPARLNDDTDMTENYCPSCYRTLTADRPACPSCEARRAVREPHLRLPLLIGAGAGVPLYVYGVLRPDPRACLVGAIIAGGAVLAYVLGALWSAGRAPER
jgi:hypothetical protein